MGAERSKGRHVEALDGLRALAVLGVVGYHMGIGWCQGGLLGVAIMFVLSGYLITGLLLVEYRKTRTFDLKDFWRRRLRRLMPQAIACVLVTAALCTLFNHVLLTKMRNDVIPSLLMYLNWAKIFSNESYFAAAGGPSPLTHYWTLAIEAQFYLVWPPVLLLLIRRNAKRTTIEIVLLVCAILSAIGMALTYSPNVDPSRSYYGTDTRAFSLLLGCLLAIVWPFDRVSSWTVEGIASHDRRVVEGVGVGSIAVLVIMMVVTKGYAAFPFRGGTFLCSVIACLAIGALMPEGSFVAKVMSSQPLVWLGSRSYAIYLWHFPIIQLMTNRNSTSPTPFWWYLLELALSLGAAELSYRYIEVPLRKEGAIRALVKRPETSSQGGHASHGASEHGAHGSGRRASGRPSPAMPVSWLQGNLKTVVPAVVVALIAVGGLLFVPAANAVGGGPDDKRVSAASLRRPLSDGQYDVILIGDSVALDSINELEAALPHGMVDCRVGRQADEALSVYDSYRDQGVVGDIVVFAIGTNGTLTQGVLDQIVSDVGPDKQLYFVNNRMPDSFQDENNALIGDLPSQYSNVHVIDWHGLSSGHDDWFWSDGTHLKQGTDALQQYADMVVTAIGYEDFISIPTAYDVTLIGDSISLDASDALATSFPEGVIDCAEGREPKDIANVYQGYANQGLVGGSVVVSIGNESIVTAEDVDSIISAVGTDHTLWIVNSRTSDPWCQDNNAVIANAAAGHDNVHVIDWYDASSGHDDWFAGDGSHLSDSGKTAFAQTLVNAMGYVVPSTTASSTDAAA